MEFTVAGPDAEHLKMRLQHCFNFDHLSPTQGIAILVGIEPNAANIKYLSNFYNQPDELKLFEKGIQLLDGVLIGSDPIIFIETEQDGSVQVTREGDIREISNQEHRERLQDARNRFVDYASLNNKLFKYWNSGMHPDVTPLSYFIEWAKSKKFTPTWLDCAIEVGLYTEKQDATEQAQAVTEKSLVDTESSEILPVKGGLGRRDDQINSILAEITALKFDPQKIPDGGKSIIKLACLKQAQLFTDSGFDRAWKAGRKEKLFKLLNHHKYKH